MNMTTSDAQLEERRRAAIREREREAQVNRFAGSCSRIRGMCSLPGGGTAGANTVLSLPLPP